MLRNRWHRGKMAKAKLNFIKAGEILFLFLWSSGYIGAKIGIPLSGTFTILFFRYAIVVVITFLYVSYKREWSAPNKNIFFSGFLAHFFWLTVILKSFEYGMNAGSAALIAALQPILTAVFAAKILNEKTNKTQWLGIFIGFLGVLVFVSGDTLFGNVHLWVYLLPLLAALSLTLVTILERKRKKLNQSLPIMTTLFWQSLLTLILLSPLAYFAEDFHAVWGFAFLFSVSWLALVVSIAAYAMMYFLIRTRNTTRVSALQYFVPPTTMFIAYLVFGESLTLLGIFGLLISSLGFYIFFRGEKIKIKTQFSP